MFASAPPASPRGVNLGALAPVAAVLLAGAGCESAAADAAGYRISRVERRTVVATVEVTGHLEARRPRVVTALREGRLAGIEVAAGDTVTSGRVLARLEPGTTELAVSSQRAAVAAAAARLDEARARKRQAASARDRARRMRAKGQTSQAELEEAEMRAQTADAAVRIAQAEHQGARTDLARAQRDFDATEVVAPADGVVLTAPTEVGAAVGPSGPELFRLADPLETLQLVAEVGEAEIARLAPGQPTDFEVQAFPGEWFPAEIERIGLNGSREQGVATYMVELIAENGEGRLRPGMTAAVRFEVGRADDALAVREAALRFVPLDAEPAPPRSRVFAYEGSNQITPIAVSAGVSDGAYTVIEPSRPLAVGAAVAIGYGVDGVTESTETNLSLGGSR